MGRWPSVVSGGVVIDGDPVLTVIRRTFEAATHPEGSEERARLNLRAETSEYRPARRWLTSDGKSHTRKCDAQFWADQVNEYTARD